MSIDVQAIKQKYPLARLAREEVTNLKATKPDGWYLGYCPFCQGATAGTDSKGKRRNPSELKFWIDTRKGFCSCFRPKCRAQNPGGRPMDVINFYARLHNLTNRQAIFELADILGMLPEPEQQREYL